MSVRRTVLLLSSLLLGAALVLPLSCTDVPGATDAGQADADADGTVGDAGVIIDGGDSDVGDAETSADADAGAKAVHLTPFKPDAGMGSLADALESTKFLYIPPGDYTIDRPVKLSGRRGGVVLGAGRGATRIHLAGSSGITIDDSRDLLIGNFMIDVSAPSIADDLFHVGGTTASEVSFLGLLVGAGQVVAGHVVGRTSFRVDSPSVVTLQGVHVNLSNAAVLIDHPGADVHLFGGNHQSNNTHIHQKRGHLDMRAVALQGGYDQDIVIESASAAAPHVIEGVRTEGPNELIVVPPTADHVDVLVAASSLPVAATAVRYAGHGTLWLMSNNFKGAVSASAGVVKSLGNAFDEGAAPADRVATAPFAIVAPAALVSTGDLLTVKSTIGTPYNHSLVMNAAAFTAGQLPQPAQVTFASAVAPGDVPVAAPAVKAVLWPHVDNLADLMPSVKTFGAVGDGVADDTTALRAAFASARKQALYFPPGTYRLTAPIAIDHWFGSTFWGEGGDQSRLVNVTNDTVLRTNGCGYTTFVGLGFETQNRGTGKALDLSWDGTNTADSNGGALQANMFYRTAFVGGSEGVSIGAGGFMGSEHMFVEARFSKSAVGLSTHNYNALTDVVIDSDFVDVDNAAVQTAGSFHLYGDRFEGVTHQGVSYVNTAWDTFVVRDSTWSEPAVFAGTGFTGARIQLLVANVVFATRHDAANANAFNYGAGGSVTLFGVDLGDRTLTSYSSADGEGTVVILSTKASSSMPFAVSNHAYLFR